jgi:hypothetical protein
MDRYIARSGNVRQYLGSIEQTNYQIIYAAFARATAREVWHIESTAIFVNNERILEIRRGMILATEVSPNRTKVDFLDGQYFTDNNIVSLRTSIPQRQSSPEPVMTVGYPIGDNFIDMVTDVKKEFERDNEGDSAPTLTKRPTTLIERIEAIEYPGSVEHFRAWMDKYLAINGDVFTTPSKPKIREYRISYSSSARAKAREVWHVTPLIRGKGKDAGSSKWATILAVEESPNKTSVEFIDGLFYHRDTRLYKISMDGEKKSMPMHGQLTEYAYGESIGDDFIKLCEDLKSAWKKNFENPSKSETHVSTLPEEPKTNNLKEWFDYLHAVKHVTRIKLEYIANKTKYAYSTVKKEHSLYLKEHGIQKVTKSNQK